LEINRPILGKRGLNLSFPFHQIPTQKEVNPKIMEWKGPKFLGRRGNNK